MGQTKIQFKWFTIPQYKQEEEYLSSMHREGWKFTKVSFPGFYHFTKSEPENVTYRLDYNQEGVAHKSEYVRMFSDCGWEYLFEFVGYSYFRKASDEADLNEEIFCDDESRLDMMKRVYKGRVVPLIIIFFSIILPQLLLNTHGYGGGGIVRKVLSGTFVGLVLLYIMIFISMTIQFYQYEKNIYPDRNLKSKYASIFAGIVVGLVVILGVVIWSNRSNYEMINRDHGFTIEAQSLNKSIVKEYKLNKGDKVYIMHEGDDGELYISIGQENEKPIFYGNTVDEFGKFSVEIKADGVYQIKCSGKRASGTIEVEVK